MLRQVSGAASGIILSILMPLTAHAEITATEGEELLTSVISVADAKSMMREALETLDQCGAGSCYNVHTTLVCEIVAALDVKVNGAIVGEWKSSEAEIIISPSDLRHTRDIYAQCKPTNYQYWHYKTMLHVGYRPTKQADVRIRHYLGVKPKKAPKPVEPSESDED